jgi:NitT/TauT family transport system permease protein
MRRVALYRLLVIAAAVLVLELLCLLGVIPRLTMQPPHRIIYDLAVILASGSLNGAIVKTLTNASIAIALAVVVGVVTAVVLHGHRAVRETLDPLFATYYAVPIFAFYPLLIVLLGLGDAPQIGIGFMLGVVAVIVNTLNGLDRVPPVLRKAARMQRLGALETALSVTLPHAAPFVLTGAKFAVAYSLIGVIGAEFIMSRGGIGYEISFAYTNFDNATMYPLILLILAVSISINAALSWWERVILSRRGR